MNQFICKVGFRQWCEGIKVKSNSETQSRNVQGVIYSEFHVASFSLQVHKARKLIEDESSIN